MTDVKFKIAGDKAILIEFGNEISEEINKKIIAFAAQLSMSEIFGIIEIVPAYCSVTVHYLPEYINYDQLVICLKNVIDKTKDGQKGNSLVYEIPVLYGAEAGPDLEFVAKYNNKTEEEVIKIHSSKEYLIYMLGFTPGFPFLGGMDKSIATPRLEKPRLLIPAGSVGIAGEQTGIYSLDTPGGWQLIGQTPIKLFEPEREKPILLEAGNYIKFKPISKEMFLKINEEAEAGRYICNSYDKEV